MKSILTKLGKLIGVIRHEGFINGGKRVVEGWFKFFIMVVRKAKPADILFITGGVSGDVTQYRSFNQKEELETHGFSCSVVSQDNLWLPSYAGNFQIFIFQRVLFTPSVSNLIKKIRKNNREIIFETDDLVFDPKYLKDIEFFKKMNSLEKKMYESGLGGEILNDSYVKTCVTSTSFLAKKIKEKGKQVFISKDKISNEELMLSEEILKKGKKSEDGFIRI
jgi:hypothetical protein